MDIEIKDVTGGLVMKENVEKLIENLKRPTIHTNILMIMEEKELRLRKVSGYTIEELTELFLSGAVEINKDRIPQSFQMKKGVEL